jgi:hypothetical protein
MCKKLGKKSTKVFCVKNPGNSGRFESAPVTLLAESHIGCGERDQNTMSTSLIQSSGRMREKLGKKSTKVFLWKKPRNSGRFESASHSSRGMSDWLRRKGPDYNDAFTDTVLWQFVKSASFYFYKCARNCERNRRKSFCGKTREILAGLSPPVTLLVECQIGCGERDQSTMTTSLIQFSGNL